jgi:hypothetical protein
MPLNLGWQYTRGAFAIPVARHRSSRREYILVNPGDHSKFPMANSIVE